MKIPFFNQGFLEFFKSKTNLAALVSVGIGLFMMYTGEMNVSVMMVTQGLAALGLRDAMTKK